MSITPDELRHVARIARIDLSDAEVEKFIKQVNDIIAWFQELGKIDTKGVEPSFQPVRTENVFRPDEVGACLSQDDALINTDASEKGYFKGPRAV